MLDIKIEKTKEPKIHPKEDDPLAFGTIFTDHMFIMDYTYGQGWHDARIVPYQPLMLDPAAMVFHYGQEMFEGMKAYYGVDGSTLLFRPEKNAQRANHTCHRLCMPNIEELDYIQAIKALVKVDESWVPTKEGTSLYIRPYMIATEPRLGVRPSQTYHFVIILSPVGAYYPEGLDPVKIWVEENYIRAANGGIGEAKTGGNYVASMKAQEEAAKYGYSQVLWLDAKEKKYVEEVGAMNIFFKIGETIITPQLTGSILPGVTRDTCISLCKEWGYTVEERRISIGELEMAAKEGTLKEVWGTGTAAVISPVGELNIHHHPLKVADGEIGELSQRLYDTVTAIQLGKIEDVHGWVLKV
ncbi:MAG TPA: branched-chain amino acid aminotransferase [Candidatus Merdenecus merdavium]|nr:branched-chain amino acid aminotransferase [Candidatus Merdenecus merdavium]